MSRGRLTIVTTNDLIASFAPQDTSYGRLPGAQALVDEVAELRASGEVVWIDTGDFAQGSPLGALSDGVWGFAAARELPIDVAVVGNHELDWGHDHLRRWARELPFPLLAANAELRLPGTTVIERAGRRIGVVGLTYPAMSSLHPGVEVAEDTVGVARERAAGLRDQGADLIVVALHDGPDWTLRDGRLAGDPSRVEDFCRGIQGSGIDLVLGGHTLVAHVGPLEGLPFLQPWPFGSQLGIAEIAEDGAIALRTVDPTRSRPWEGLGAGAYRELEQEVVAETNLELANGVLDRSLAKVVAEGMLEDADADIAVAIPTDMWNQPPRDGIYAFLPAGKVTLAQILRLAPLTGGRSAWGGQVALAELPACAAARAVEAVRSDSRPPGSPAAVEAFVAERPDRGSTVRLAVAPRLRPLVERAAETEVEWPRTESTWRTSLIVGLRAPARGGTRRQSFSG